MMARNNTYHALTTGSKRVSTVTDDELLHIRAGCLLRKNEPAADKFLTLFSSSGNNGVFLTDTTDKAAVFFPAGSVSRQHPVCC